jgi:hypothetical protein
MAEPTESEVMRVAGEGEEEIIEKKPSAPEATVLMILTTIFLGLAIYIAADEMKSYFNKKDYEAQPEKTAAKYYGEFKNKFPEPVEEPIKARE